MRYALVSDVHGNLEALVQVLAFLATQRIDRYDFLGDAVGYGPNPNEVCDLLRRRMDIAIVGNHDAAVSDRLDYDNYYSAAKDAIDWCRGQLSSQNMAWLQRLPYSAREHDVGFSHGTPLVPEVFDYLFTEEQATDLLVGLDTLAPVTFIGHSHLTLAFRLDASGATELIGDSHKLLPDARYIITAGSVGQPRDRDPRACCGIFDSDSQLFTFHRVAYDVVVTRQKIIDAGLSPMFGDRLLLGV